MLLSADVCKKECVSVSFKKITENTEVLLISVDVEIDSVLAHLHIYLCFLFCFLQHTGLALRTIWNWKNKKSLKIELTHSIVVNGNITSVPISLYIVCVTFDKYDFCFLS